MLIDREQLLTGGITGEAFTPNDGVAAYGSSEYDLKSDGYNPAVGGQIGAYVMPTVNAAGPTTIAIAILASDDASGTNAVVLATRTFTVGTDLLTTVGVQKIGILNTIAVGANSQYLLARVTPAGANMTAGTLKIWLAKDDTDASPHNEAVKL